MKKIFKKNKKKWLQERKWDKKEKKRKKNLYFLLNAKFVDVSVRIPLIVWV